jgi:hypothetical protein
MFLFTTGFFPASCLMIAGAISPSVNVQAHFHLVLKHSISLQVN